MHEKREYRTELPEVASIMLGIEILPASGIDRCTIIAQDGCWSFAQRESGGCCETYQLHILKVFVFGSDGIHPYRLS